MKLKSVFKNFLLFSTVIAFSLGNFSCEKEQDDACIKTETSTKVVNMRAYLHVETVSGVPVVDEDISLNISFFPCGGDIAVPEDAIASYDFDGPTDEDGNRESDIVNFVLNNTQDRIVVNAVAPNLNYYQQNFHKIIMNYVDVDGAALDEVHLYIYQLD